MDRRSNLDENSYERSCLILKSKFQEITGFGDTISRGHKFYALQQKTTSYESNCFRKPK